MPSKKKNNIINFPSAPTKLERQVEAILFSASEPLDIETIEKRVQTNVNIKKILENIREIYKKRGINTVLITTNKLSSKVSDLDLSFLIGPELISGSTRLKSGTVTKVALNIITSMAMIKADKVLNGLMIDIKPTTNKLRARCIRNTAIILNLTLNMAEKLLIKSKWNTRVAIIMNNKNMSYKDALKISKTLPIGEII